MSLFSDAIKDWVDEENLIGSSPHPTKWSTGNALLETAIAITMEVELNGSNSNVSLLRRLVGGMGSCLVTERSFNKNPMRLDQITHDDLLAAAATQRIVSTSFATHIVKYGQRNGWDLSNNGQKYWDAQAKPWEVAFYELVAGQKTSFFNKTALIIEITISFIVAAFKKGNPSGERLTWLRLIALKGCSQIIDVIMPFWHIAMNKKYGTVGNMMRAYYNNDSHPFVIFGNNLKF